MAILKDIYITPHHCIEIFSLGTWAAPQGRTSKKKSCSVVCKGGFFVDVSVRMMAVKMGALQSCANFILPNSRFAGLKSLSHLRRDLMIKGTDQCTRMHPEIYLLHHLVSSQPPARNQCLRGTIPARHKNVNFSCKFYKREPEEEHLWNNF